MVPEQDQAAALARALEGGASASPEIDSLVSLARMLGTLPQPTIDASFANRLEARLALEAAAPAAVGVGVGVVVQLESRRRRLRRTLAIAIAAAMLFAIPVAASANAGPGSPLYGVRLRVEGLRLWARCTGGAVECGFAHLDRASARVADLREVIAQADTSMVSVTSHRIRGDMSSGTNKILQASPPVATLERLSRRLQITTSAIGDLMYQLPLAARGELAQVLASGNGLSDKVRLAIDLINPAAPSLTTPLPPPGPVVVPKPAPAPKKQTTTEASAPAQSSSSVHTHRSVANDKSGPGGAPNLNAPPPGETWTSNNTTDSCPLGAVSAPGVSTVCNQVGGKA